MHKQTPMRLVDGRSHFWEIAKTTDSHIQMSHKNLSPPFLIRLVKLVSSLNVCIGRV